MRQSEKKAVAKDGHGRGNLTLPAMHRHALRLFKLWLIRQLTFLPLIVLLAVGFRAGWREMTPEARWHPAFKPAGPLALLVLVAFAAGWLPFDPMALGMLLFILVGCIGIIALGYGFDGIHLVYTPMAQAMMFVWICIVCAGLALGKPQRLLGQPHATPRTRLAAWGLTGAAALTIGLSYLLRRQEALAGLLPFLALLGAKGVAARWARGGQPAHQGEMTQDERRS